MNQNLGVSSIPTSDLRYLRAGEGQVLGTLHVGLQAHHRGRGHHRGYEVSVGRDLFGSYTVDVSYGRIGGWHRTIRYSAATEDEARRMVRSLFRRRASAPSRIGCAYKLTRLSAANDLEVQDWVTPGFQPARPQAAAVLLGGDMVVCGTCGRAHRAITERQGIGCSGEVIPAGVRVYDGSELDSYVYLWRRRPPEVGDGVMCDECIRKYLGAGALYPAYDYAAKKEIEPPALTLVAAE
jgi:hypothetical protein